MHDQFQYFSWHQLEASLEAAHRQLVRLAHALQTVQPYQIPVHQHHHYHPLESIQSSPSDNRIELNYEMRDLRTFCDCR